MKNAQDRARAEQIGREVTEAILKMGRRGRVWVEVQTDASGHIRSDYEIRTGQVVSLADDGR